MKESIPAPSRRRAEIEGFPRRLSARGPDAAAASEQLAFVLQMVEARKMKAGPGQPSRGEEESR